MKKIILILFGVIVLVILMRVLLSVFQKPIESVVGCYEQESVIPHDVICLYGDGSYKQFLLNADGVENASFNNGNWRSYSVDNDHGSMVGVTASNYFDKFGDSSELDFFPYKTLLGKVMFVTSGSESNKDRFYIRRSKNK